MKNFKNILENLTPEQINRLNNELIDAVLKEHAQFKAAFENGDCYICNKELKSVDISTPCHHWLLNPNGLKKRHIELFFNTKPDFLGILTYLRWVANTEKNFQNVNNLLEEMNSAKILEQTIIYKDIEWSFSLAPSDFTGHKGSSFTDFPHYHLQMIIGGRNFISFNNFHIPLTEDDIMKISAMIDMPDKLKWIIPQGEGMQEIIEQGSEVILDNLRSSSDEENATFNLSTIALAKPGTTITGEEIQKLYEESKNTGLPLAVLMKKLNADVSTIITPGDGVPDISKRNPRKKKNS